MAKHNTDKALCQRTAKGNLEIIMQHLRVLKPELQNTAKEFYNDVTRGVKLTESQLNYVDNIYEKVMKGLGFDSCNLHVDRKRKSLRY